MHSRLKISLVLIAALLLFSSPGTGCARRDSDDRLNAITSPHLFSIVRWELDALGAGVRNVFYNRQETTDDDISDVTTYFANTRQVKELASEIGSVTAGDRQLDLAALGDELDRRQQQKAAKTGTVERILETQIRETLSRQGISNPLERYIGPNTSFPPVNFKLGEAPHLLVVSPRDRIESLREITLTPAMNPEAMESLESEVDKLGVSSLVVALGGISTYPNLVTDGSDLQFIIETAVHEWVHQYLFFKPLGFLYLLDLAGLRPDYEIATMNETVAAMVSREIGAIMIQEYYAQHKPDHAAPARAPGFDYDKEMREIRMAVDDYLARGDIETAEKFMEQKQQYLESEGYYIRKLNQAYFAFYGTYADGPASISPIGVELKKLRGQSASLKDFLETAAAMTSRQDLAGSVK